MATTQTRSARASGLPFYLWEVPQKPISIQLYFEVIDRMHPDIMRGLGALKRRGAEVGGILLGRSEPGPRRKVIVEDFDPVPSEYLTGPSYNLSENDRIAFEAAIARRRAAAGISGQSVVGFYRSHTRDSLFMDDADLALATGYFSDPENVFLLIKPFATRSSVGGFFFWEDGAIKRESSYLQFPFDRRELGGGENRPAPLPPRHETERPLPPYIPAAEQPRQPEPRSIPDDGPWSEATRTNLSILSAPPPPSSRVGGIPAWRWLLVPIFLAIAALAGFFAYRDATLPRTAPPVSSPTAETALPLRLSVAERQNQLDVTWDRNTPAIAKARRGVLSISDGQNKRDLDLSGAQLRTGRVLYSRLSGDVALRLEVFADGPESVTESIRIVSTEPPPSGQETPLPAADPLVVEKAKPIPASPAPVRTAPAPVKRVVAATPKESAPKELAPTPPAETPQPEPELQRPARRR
jgi:hypothetical protein